MSTHAESLIFKEVFSASVLDGPYPSFQLPSNDTQASVRAPIAIKKWNEETQKEIIERSETWIACASDEDAINRTKWMKWAESQKGKPYNPKMKYDDVKREVEKVKLDDKDLSNIKFSHPAPPKTADTVATDSQAGHTQTANSSNEPSAMTDTVKSTEKGLKRSGYTAGKKRARRMDSLLDSGEQESGAETDYQSAAENNGRNDVSPTLDLSCTTKFDTVEPALGDWKYPVSPLEGPNEGTYLLHRSDGST